MQHSRRKKASNVSSSMSCMGKCSSKRSSEYVKPTDHEASRLRIDLPSAEKTFFWTSFLDGFQRVIIFTDDPICAKETIKVGYHLGIPKVCPMYIVSQQL